MYSLVEALEVNGITRITVPCGKQVKLRIASRHADTCQKCIGVEAERRRRIWDGIMRR